MSKARELARVPVRDHGELSDDVLAALGVDGEPILDLATAHNGYGPPAQVRDALTAAPLARYPDMTAQYARRAIAERFSTTPARVVLGQGASELIWSCMRVLVRPGDAVLVVEPGYAELSAAARQCGARVLQWRAVERSGHRVDLEQVAELLLLEKPSVVCLCAPASPSGASIPWSGLQALATRFADSMFVVDQSHLALSEDHLDLEQLPTSNVVCIRSLGKELGVCGVRAGYLLCESGLATRIEACRPAFSTSAYTQALAACAMRETSFIESSRTRLLEDRARTAFVLQKLGLVATPSVTCFLLLRMARATEVARELLQQHRVHVRDCTSFGLPDHVRIAGVRACDERRLERALRDVTERRRLSHGREAG